MVGAGGTICVAALWEAGGGALAERACSIDGAKEKGGVSPTNSGKKQTFSSPFPDKKVNLFLCGYNINALV